MNLIDLLQEGIHFDPVNALVVLCFAVAIWTQLRNTVKWHTSWIHKHEEDDKVRDQILSKCTETNAKLTVLVDTHCDRIERIEDRIDRSSV